MHELMLALLLSPDMYTFDTDEESAMETYHKVCDAYCNVFDRIGVHYEKGTGVHALFVQGAEI